MEKKTTLGDIMWFDILKDSKQINRTVSSLNWDEEEIPDEEDDDCKRELRKLWEKSFSHKNENTTKENKFYWSSNHITEVPNEVFCVAVDLIKNVKLERYVKTPFTEVQGYTILVVFQHNMFAFSISNKNRMKTPYIQSIVFGSNDDYWKDEYLDPSYVSDADWRK